VGASASERLRRKLVRGLRIESDAVRAAFLAVARERFLPGVALESVYRDEAILTKFASNGAPLSSSSAPSIMAAMLERLELEPGMRVLEIGTGTGYNAALIAELVGPRGSVTTIDVDAELVRKARAVLRGVAVVAGDGRAGHVRRAPYDRIVVTASSDTVPRAWFDQLSDGGLLEVPLRIAGAQVIPTLRKRNGRLSSVATIPGGFMPLRGAELYGEAPPPSLVATDLTDRDHPPPICQVSSEGLSSLSAAAKRRLLATALDDGAVRRVPVRDDRDALMLYLALALPTTRMVKVWPGWTIGLFSRDGASLAYVDGNAGMLRVHGDERAADELERSIEAWSERGRPGAAQLRFTIDYDGAEPRLRRRWAQANGS
jgi:protein-L-isoaspartate(D-aspartate) O-methyltransferase